MPTAEELLARAIGADAGSVLKVDINNRIIIIPEDVTHLGVESDDDVMRLNFRIDRYYNDHDLFTFEKQINYENARGIGDVYKITDAVESTSYFTFSWLVGRNAVSYKGDVKFNLCFKKYDNNDPTIVTEEFNTTPATLPVLEGLETSERVIQQYSDILVRWENELFGMGESVAAEMTERITTRGEQVLASIPEDYTDLHNTAQMALRTRANAIVWDFNGTEIQAVNAARDPLRSLRVFGRSTQAGTPTPSAPIDIASVGDGGTVTVSISGDDGIYSITANTPNGLCGIPVTIGGNYVDADGQQWICDEIDFERGVYIKRVAKETMTIIPRFGETTDKAGRFVAYGCLSNVFKNGSYPSITSVGTWSSWGHPADGQVVTAANVNGLYFSPIETMTADEVDALFTQMIGSANPPVIMGQLATPIEIPLSDEEIASFRMARCSYPTTYVINTDDAWMDLKYNVDTELFFLGTRGATDEQVEASVVKYLNENNVQVPSDTHIQNVVQNYILNNPTQSEGLTETQINALIGTLK